MKKLTKIILLALTVALLVSVPFVVSAGANEPALNIEAANLSFEDSVYPIFAVSSEGIDASSVKLLVWTSPKTSDSEYIKGSENVVLDSYADETIDGVPCKKFKYTKLYSKNMTDDIYVRAYAEVDGEPIYSGLVKYSILKYAYNKLGFTGTATIVSKLKLMLENMLLYGASAQQYFDYKTDRLATDSFYQIAVDGGYLADGTSSGLYLPGESVTITAPATDAEGREFVAWLDELGVEVATDASATIAVAKANAIYTASYELKRPVCPGADVEHTKTNAPVVFVKTVDPECGKFGYDLYECATCKAPVLTNWTEVGEGRHKWSDVEAIPHTCETDGVLAHYKCDLCGVLSFNKRDIVTAADVVDAAKHDYDLTVPIATFLPSCTRYGLWFYGCSICGLPAIGSDDASASETPIPATAPAGSEWISDGILRIPEDPHAWTTTEVKANCQHGGYKLDTCACGATRIDATTQTDGKYDVVASEPNVHEWDPTKTVITTAPTCTDEGVALDWCIYCGAHESHKVDALGHKFGDLQAKVEPDCDSTGFEAYYACSVCNKKFVSNEKFNANAKTDAELTIAATGHNYQWIISSPDGTYESYMCVVGNGSAGCGHVKDTRETEPGVLDNWIPID